MERHVLGRLSGARFYLLLLLALLAPACSSLPIYSEARDKQGEAAKKAWKEVDVRGVIAAERSDLNALLAVELESQLHLASVRRDQYVRSLATGSSLRVGVLDAATRELELLGLNAADASDWALAKQRADEERADSREKLLDAALEFRRGKQILPECRDVMAGKPPKGAAVAEEDVLGPPWKRAREACAALAKIEEPAVSGQLADALRALASAEKARDGAKEAAREQKALYASAKTAYDDALERIKTGSGGKVDEDALSKLRVEANALQVAASALDEKQDAYSIRTLAEDRLESINDFLAALGTGSDDPLPEALQKGSRAIALVPKLAEDAQKSLAKARMPLLAPWVMQKNYEQLRLDAANREIAVLETSVELHKDRVAVLEREAMGYVDAIKLLNSAPKKYLDMEAWQALALSKSTNANTEKQKLWKATAFYLDAKTRHHGEAVALATKIRALQDERMLALAETNTMQWQALIDVSVDQLEAYGKSGVKATTVAALLNSLTLLWIGGGVNP